MSLQNLARLSCGSRVLDLSLPQVMGVLNVTPDSFSDGGRFLDIDTALHHAESMVAAGAALVDVGVNQPGREHARYPKRKSCSGSRQ